MADINFSILDAQAPARAAAIPQQMQEQQAQNAMRLMQIQGTMQQNELAKAKMEDYKRGLTEQNLLRSIMSRPGFDIYDPKSQAEAMAASPTYASPLIKHALDVRKTESEINKSKAQAEGAQTKAAKDRQEFINQAKRDLSANPSDDNIKAWAQDAVIQKIFSADQASQMLANLLKVPLADRQAMFASAGAAAPSRTPSPLAKLMAERDALPLNDPRRAAYDDAIANLRTKASIDPTTGRVLNLVTGEPIMPGQTPASRAASAAALAPGAAPTPGVAPAPGQPTIVRNEQDALNLAKALDRAGLPVNVLVPGPGNALAGAQPPVNALPSALPSSGLTPRQELEAFKERAQASYQPVQVIDPASGNTVYVSREEAIRRNMTPADKSFNLTPKQIQTLEAKFPQSSLAVKTFENSAEQLSKDLKTLAEHPGLSGISGLIYGRTPAVTKDARRAEALYNSIIARGGFNELQAMRNASPAGAALGNVSNTENQYLRDAFAPIKLTQDTPDLKKALLDAANAVENSKQRIREAFDLTYEYRVKQGGSYPRSTAPASASPAADRSGSGVDTSNPLLR